MNGIVELKRDKALQYKEKNYPQEDCANCTLFFTSPCKNCSYPKRGHYLNED